MCSSYEPEQSCSLSLSRSSDLVAESASYMSLALSAPGEILASVVPVPQDSVGYLIVSNTRPADIASLALQDSAASSLAEQYPHLVDSDTTSLLPVPLSPIVEAPSPCASADAP